MDPKKDLIHFDSKVEIDVFRMGELIERFDIKNTTLAIGRRQLAAALGGNLLGSSHEAYVQTMDWGTEGVDGSGNVRAVPDTATGFVGGGSVLDSTAVVASMATGDEPTVFFSSAIGTSASSNGSKISQIGLKMKSGAYWAITTWKGVDKDALTTITINWKVYFL